MNSHERRHDSLTPIQARAQHAEIDGHAKVDVK